jgi:hypothetical protein
MEDRQGYTLTDAARILRTSEGALRQRIRRGSLESYKEHGRVYVYIPDTHDVQDDAHTPESHTLISEIQARVELLEQELERAHERDRETRRLLAAALERIPPQIEAPSKPRESPATPPVKPERAEPTEPEDLETVEPERVEPEMVEHRLATAEAQEGAQRTSASGRARRNLPVLGDVGLIMLVLGVLGFVVYVLLTGGSP